MALRHTDRRKILISSALHPHYRETIKTYLKGTPYQIEEFGFDENDQFNREDFLKHLNSEVAGAVFQTPNFFGVVENLQGAEGFPSELCRGRRQTDQPRYQPRSVHPGLRILYGQSRENQLVTLLRL